MEQRIYVACLASYSNGKLHGAWLAVESVKQLNDGIKAMLAESPEQGAEEYAIHDSEGLGDVSEHEDLAELVERTEFLREHGEVGRVVFEYMGDLDEAREAMENFEGEFATLEEWAVDYADNTGLLDGVPENLRYYFDFKSWARDTETGDYVYTIPGGRGVYVFRSSR